MNQKRKTPTAGDCGRRKSVSLGFITNQSEHNYPAHSLQDLRIAHLARRFRLPPALAAAVANLAFEGAPTR